MVRARARPAARPAGAGLRLALGRAVPRRGRTPDPGLRRPRRVRAADAARLPARRRGPRGASIRAGGVRASVLMNCSGKHAAMLATCVANGWDTATYLEAEHPLQQGDRRHLRRAHRRARRAVAVDGCGAPLLSASLIGLARAFRTLAVATDGPERRVADADPRAPGVRLRAPSATSSPCSPRCPARSARPARSPATPWRCPTAGAFALKTDDGAPRVRPVLMAEALRRTGGDRRARRGRRRP